MTLSMELVLLAAAAVPVIGAIGVATDKAAAGEPDPDRLRQIIREENLARIWTTYYH